MSGRIDADEHLRAVTWEVAYTDLTETNRWEKLIPDFDAVGDRNTVHP